MKSSFLKYTLNFSFEAGTSRGVMHTRDSWFVFIQSEGGKTGIGECSPLPGLSADNIEGIESLLQSVCHQIDRDLKPSIPEHFPAVRFALEMAKMDMKNGGQKLFYPSAFTRGETGMPINGLVWMGDFDFMQRQVKEKIESGFNCIKLKIGAIDFEKELELIRMIRREFSASDIEIRVDANGAFDPEHAMEKLKRLSEYDLHSIEQPIGQKQWEQMAGLCEKTPLPIALDEELIGIHDPAEKHKLLSTIRPQYIILKPGLLGGFQASEEWINLAEDAGTGWWVTSALESNIGLNAIAQWTYSLKNSMPQGLGTGQLFTNNFGSPLYISEGALHYDPKKDWQLSRLQ